jgi:hypothetical protein
MQKREGLLGGETLLRAQKQRRKPRARTPM